MSRLYINPTLEKSIKSYCELNEIEDINAFANRCTLQGFNIVKFGISPKDNIDKENNGIKDIKKNGTSKKKEDTPRENKGEQGKEQESIGREEFKEESKPIEKRKESVVVRKIQVIKKQ